jgi:hypothetical protein
MANQRIWGKQSAANVAALLFILAVGASSVSVAAVPVSKTDVKPKGGSQVAHVVDSHVSASGVYRSTMSDGKVVFSDRPLAGSTQVSIANYAGGTDAAAVALKERDYWRQRSEAFAERQRLREKDLEETRRAALTAERRNEATVIVVPQAGSVAFVHGGHNARHSAVQSVYSSSPGAVNGRAVAPLPTGNRAR